MARLCRTGKEEGEYRHSSQTPLHSISRSQLSALLAIEVSPACKSHNIMRLCSLICVLSACVRAAVQRPAVSPAAAGERTFLRGCCGDLDGPASERRRGANRNGGGGPG